MSITRDEVAHLARLSRLALTPEELDRFAGQLDVIISAVARVQEVAASGQPAGDAVTGRANVFREDVVVPPLPATAVLDQAPAAQDGYFRVPRILDQD
jgi:aspartyl-tRNA(Asn)/glutamyl-tRNA(Gln) amidotransferase subunit C